MIPPGGGGDPRGVGTQGREASAPKEDVPDQPKQTQENVPLPATPDALPEKIDELPVMPTIDPKRPTSTANEALEASKALSAAVQRSQGLGGRGEGGGRGTGTGKGTGAGEGEGKQGKINQRQKRVLRWVMHFSTLNGNDYANQLQGLGATLAYLDPANPQQYLIIKDLSKRPVKGDTADIASINKIYWVDKGQQSVEALAIALGLKETPPHFVAFFPLELENRLLKLELDYARKQTGKNVPEDAIEETVFAIDRSGSSYTPRVESQRRLR
jgi:hypothetical protein